MNKKNNRIKFSVRLCLIIIVSIFLWTVMFGNGNEKESELSYDKVISYIKCDEVTKIEAQKDSLTISVKLKDGTEKKAVVPDMEEFTSLVSKKIENGAEIEFKVNQTNTVLIGILSAVGNIAVWVIVLFALPKIMTSMTGSKYEIKSVKSDKRFSDVAGIDEEKEQLEEVVQFLKAPQKYIRSGAKIPKGIILHGAPGTGKTLLAKAVAGEAGVPFFQTTGSSFEEKLVGVGASRIRELFAEAKKVAPAIIFIDEIDAVAQSRYSGRSYSEQTLNQLLAEMDGFGTNDNVIVMAATNHIDILDSALIRPGRFDRHVYVPMPDVVAREKILQVHSRNKRFDGISLEEVAKKTVGFSGADLENVLNEATIHSVNHGTGVIRSEDIEEAIARVLVGLAKKNAAISEDDKYLTAVHEAGHAIVSAVVRPNVKNFGISIVPRGNAGGYNFFDDSDKTYQRKSDLLKQMQVLYGGRVAEELILGDISSGATNDFEKASKIGHRMLTRFAMNGSFVTKISGESDFNTKLDSNKMNELEKLCKEAYEIAYAVVEKHKTQLLELADLLMEKEYLSCDEIECFISEKL